MCVFLVSYVIPVLREPSKEGIAGLTDVLDLARKTVNEIDTVFGRWARVPLGAEHVAVMRVADPRPEEEEFCASGGPRFR